jgi:hypothetical protein
MCVSATSAATLSQLAQLAVSSDPAVSADAIRKLRATGPEGLDALMATHASAIRAFEVSGTASAEWKRTAFVIDSVAMQKDAYASHLFWYTDIKDAERIAAKESKPILTLRLLGNLNEEFSCANSRLFRSVLYANAEISAYLRDNYILHWQSVRPAPRITIDFGDGRKIERTITGNSIHYVVDSSGALVDALPGLYSPEFFLSNLRKAKESLRIATLAPGKKDQRFMAYRKSRFDEIVGWRQQSVAQAKVELTVPKEGITAIDAAPRAMTKMLVVNENSLLRVYDNFARFEAQIDLSGWRRLSAIYSPQTKLDRSSTAFIRRQNARTGRSDGEFAAMFAKLEEFIALDTTRNDFLYRPKLIEWLNAQEGVKLDELNGRVYSELFMTPNEDKWLGLYSTDVYTAIEGDGVTY